MKKFALMIAMLASLSCTIGCEPAKPTAPKEEKPAVTEPAKPDAATAPKVEEKPAEKPAEKK